MLLLYHISPALSSLSVTVTLSLDKAEEMWYDVGMVEEILNVNNWSVKTTSYGDAISFQIPICYYQICMDLFHFIFKQFGYNSHRIRLANSATFEILIYCSREQLEEVLKVANKKLPGCNA